MFTMLHERDQVNRTVRRYMHASRIVSYSTKWSSMGGPQASLFVKGYLAEIPRKPPLPVDFNKIPLHPDNHLAFVLGCVGLILTSGVSYRTFALSHGSLLVPGRKKNKQKTKNTHLEKHVDRIGRPGGGLSRILNAIRVLPDVGCHRVTHVKNSLDVKLQHYSA